MGIQNNGKIMIGGLFTAYNNIGRNRIARLQNCTGQSFSTLNVNTCNAYTAPNGQTFTQEGTYSVTIPTFNGCDSIITINLTLGAIDTTVNILPLGFQANDSLAFYQWLDCDNNFAPISGEVNREFFPNSTGNYAVRITNNGCVDTSACYSFSTVDLNRLDYQFTIKVYPNPCEEELTIEYHGRESFSYSIVDITGDVVSSGRLQLIGHRDAIDTGMLTAGIYVLQLNNEQAMRFVRR
jgi:hypothetical protein